MLVSLFLRRLNIFLWDVIGLAELSYGGAQRDLLIECYGFFIQSRAPNRSGGMEHLALWADADDGPVARLHVARRFGLIGSTR